MYPAKLPRLLARASIYLAGALALVAGSTVPMLASADSTVTPADQKVIVRGAGWGHGKGMSQYGAYGAARSGLNYSQILGFYYPGSTLSSLPSGNGMRVWITSDNDATINLPAVSGLSIRDTTGKTIKLPTGSKYTQWAMKRSGSTYSLIYRTPAKKWITYKNSLRKARGWWSVASSSGSIKVILPGGTKTYAGRLGLALRNGKAITVNYVSMETYLRNVVPSEMPPSWGATKSKGIEALKSQAVAARTYAARERAAKPSSSGYDICDTSSCQVYKSNTARNSISDTAIKATANRVLTSGGKPILAQFTSANGGWSAGYAGYSYLSAKRDPYDGLVTSQAWTKTITAASFQKAYPQIGTFISVQIATRTGVGPYSATGGSGRVTSVKIRGSKGTVIVSGGAFKTKFGLRETLFSFTANSISTAKK
jgi:stage II sporulation protein D